MQGHEQDSSTFLIFLGFLVIIAIIGVSAVGRTSRYGYSRRLAQVRKGDKLKVNISGFVVDAECLNNSPETKRMFIRKFLSSGKQSDTVEGYDEFTFHNFDALNPVIGRGRPQSNYSTKDHLEDLLKKALESEKYEDASVLRDAISKLEKEEKCS
jgi:hypothetical protein